MQISYEMVSTAHVRQVDCDPLTSNKVTMARNINAHTLELHAACNSVHMQLSQEH